ncbi:CotH kinase family protein [Candidatus Nitrosacidococcus tergens]|uniref:Bacterial Ig-like domain-containing protein n=1 Tax=Candidatus Nitrosacidococcus tergens TaxID=553981 RepID=A0A7G1QAP9_9GAMM|nr:CotH kinase family protein [Candidatus Nitrosacidococcus tergens]CAB1276827.1 exported protein of unknown function [Candidatus Nitrosacidococcus tergens]
MIYIRKSQLFIGVALLLFAFSDQSEAFSLNTPITQLTIHPGEQNVPIEISVADDGSNEPVVITMTNLPAGITVTPVTLNPGDSGVLTLSASPLAGQGKVPQEENIDDDKGLPAQSKGTDWQTIATLVGAVGSVQVTQSISLTMSLSDPAFLPREIDLPAIHIDTDNSASIIDDNYVNGIITITSPDGENYLPNPTHSDNTARFKVHGNSTANMPKLSYTIKLSKKMDVLSTMGLDCGYVDKDSGQPTCGSKKTYFLLANYDDKTFLRNWAAFWLANHIPYGGDYLDETPVPLAYTGIIPTPSGTSEHMPWAPHSLFVALYLNNIYEGLYQLVEKRDIGEHQVNIDELSELDTELPQITGGYLNEIDHHQPDPDDPRFDTNQGVPINLKNPDTFPAVPEQIQYITDYVNEAETALYSIDFTDPETGWRKYFDEAAAINFYIVNDVMGNRDTGAMYSSAYFYKARNNPFLYMGPVWDFDISSGNDNQADIKNPTALWMQTKRWYSQFFKDPGFAADVKKQWNTLKRNGVFDQWLGLIQLEAQKLNQAQRDNNDRWPMQGIRVWPNAEAAGSYQGEIDYFTNWLKLRIAYLDSVFNNDKATTTTTITDVPNSIIHQGELTTLSAQVEGASSLTGSIGFMRSGVLVGMAPIENGQATLTTNQIPAGTFQFTAVYTGDENNALSSSNPQTIVVAKPLIQTVTSLASSGDSNFALSVIPTVGGVIPTGQVVLNGTAISGKSLGTTTLSGDGTASFSDISIPGTGEGTINTSVTADYIGNDFYRASTSNSIISSLHYLFAPDPTDSNPPNSGSGSSPSNPNPPSSGSGSSPSNPNPPNPPSSGPGSSPSNPEASASRFNSIIRGYHPSVPIPNPPTYNLGLSTSTFSPSIREYHLSAPIPNPPAYNSEVPTSNLPVLSCENNTSTFASSSTKSRNGNSLSRSNTSGSSFAIIPSFTDSSISNSLNQRQSSPIIVACNSEGTCNRAIQTLCNKE